MRMQMGHMERFRRILVVTLDGWVYCDGVWWADSDGAIGVERITGRGRRGATGD